jgi:hypothetical protein
MACPHPPPIAANGGVESRRRGTLTIPEAVAARVCVYELGGHGERLERALVLRRFGAGQLTKFLRASVSARARGGTDCVFDPLVFLLRTARSGIVRVTAAGCALISGANTAVVTRATGEDISSLGGDRLDPPYRATPDIMGRQLGFAIRSERVHRWKVTAGSERIDASAQFGTVVLQYPLPGARQDTDISEISAVVAVRASPPCRGDQLRGEYQENSPTTGNGRNGAVGLRNVSRRPCSLRGIVRVVGRDRHRRRVTGTVRYRAEHPIVLSRVYGATPSLNAGTSAFEGSTHGNVVRPGGVTCDHFVQPATWLLTFGDDQQVSVPNRDPHAGTGNVEAFYSCRGNIGAVYDDLVFYQG